MGVVVILLVLVKTGGGPEDLQDAIVEEEMTGLGACVLHSQRTRTIGNATETLIETAAEAEMASETTVETDSEKKLGMWIGNLFPETAMDDVRETVTGAKGVTDHAVVIVNGIAIPTAVVTTIVEAPSVKGLRWETAARVAEAEIEALRRGTKPIRCRLDQYHGTHSLAGVSIFSIMKFTI